MKTALWIIAVCRVLNTLFDATDTTNKILQEILKELKKRNNESRI